MNAITFDMISGSCQFTDELLAGIHELLFSEAEKVSVDAVAAATGLSAENRLWILFCTAVPRDVLGQLTLHFAELTALKAVQDRARADAALVEYQRVRALAQANDDARVELAQKHRAAGHQATSRESWPTDCPPEDVRTVREILKLESEYHTSVPNAKERSDDADAQARRSAGAVEDTKRILADTYPGGINNRAYNCARYSPLTWQQCLEATMAAITTPTS